MDVRGSCIRNNLARMGVGATIRRVCACAGLLTTLSVPSGVLAADGGSHGDASAAAAPTKKRSNLVMPGSSFRRRNPVSVQAVRALSVILRTENIEDPVYLDQRTKVSDMVAEKMGIDARALHRAWSRSDRAHQIALLAALTQLDTKYVAGRESPYVQIDCSGLLWFAWRTAGVDIPRQAVSQMDRRMRVERDDAIAGDVVGEGTHVHIFLGVGRAMVHAPFNGKSVRLKMMGDEQYARVVWADPSRIATYRL